MLKNGECRTVSDLKEVVHRSQGRNRATFWRMSQLKKPTSSNFSSFAKQTTMFCRSAVKTPTTDQTKDLSKQSTSSYISIVPIVEFLFFIGKFTFFPQFFYVAPTSKFPNDRESTTQLYLIYQQFGNLKCASMKNNRTKFVRTWPTTSVLT